MDKKDLGGVAELLNYNSPFAYDSPDDQIIVRGTVVDIDSDWVTVYAGLKSEGVIPREQFLSERGDLEIQVGDEVDVALESLENGLGETRLSREKAKRVKCMKRLEEAFEAGAVVKGVVNGKVKGGFTVDIESVRAFLPGSMVDVRPVRDTGHLEGKELEFKVIKLDAKRNNVVVSRRAVLEAESSAERETLLEKLQEGMEVKGIVKHLTDYGAFVDLGGIDGLLHITDMAWKRIKHPSEIVEVGEEILVKVLKFDRDRNRVSLGLKQLGSDPWVEIANRYPEGSRVKARVTNLNDYGCFAELQEGVEGLVHVSDLDWIKKNVHPSKVVSIGDEVDVIILDVDEERRRISLGIKQCKPNPWEEFATKFNKGDKIAGKIKSITDFGIFIALDGDIDGLVHLSDISWDLPGEQAVLNYKKGDEIETVILSVESERERILLSVKQLHPKWESAVRKIASSFDATINVEYLDLASIKDKFGYFSCSYPIASNFLRIKMDFYDEIKAENISLMFEEFCAIDLILHWRPELSPHNKMYRGSGIHIACFYVESGRICTFSSNFRANEDGIYIAPSYLGLLDPYSKENKINSIDGLIEKIGIHCVIFAVNA